jgi:hypothetical protein
MFPVFPFAAGLVAGAVAVHLLRDEKAKVRLDKAQDRLREAAVSGLGTIESSMARLRDKIQAAPAAPDFPDAPDPAATPADGGGTSQASAGARRTARRGTRVKASAGGGA